MRLYPGKKIYCRVPTETPEQRTARLWRNRNRWLIIASLLAVGSTALLLRSAFLALHQ